MDNTRIIPVRFGKERIVVTEYRMQHDWGQVLDFIDIPLPEAFEARFSNSVSGQSVGQIGYNNQVRIPKQFFESGEPIYCYITVHDEETDGRTLYTTKVPIKPSSERTEEEPEPEEESIITQAITALNTAVDVTSQKAQEASESADRAEQAAEGAESYVERAEAAQNASESARDIALEAKVSAQASAATASEKASEAISSATTASQSALTAESASESASASADASYQNAQTSYRYAQDSATSAGQAESYASGAGIYASDAQTHSQTASQKASEAAQSASTATQAKTDAESAKTASQTAQGLAEQARNGAVTAKTDAESARDEAQEIIDGISGKVEQIDSNTERIESLEDDRYKPYPTDTASGAVASFPDGADGIPLKSCIVRVEPVQDLHGYDHPWPAGGGKNLIIPSDRSFTNNGVTCICSASAETVSLKGTATNSGGRTMKMTNGIILHAGKYVLSVTAVSGTKHGQYIVNKTNDNTYLSGSQFSLEEETSVYVGANVSNGTVYDEVVRIQIESGSTATSWTPYSNICPISGWDGVNVSRTGKNLAAVNMFSTSHDTVMTFSPSIPAGTYSYSYIATRTGSSTKNGAIRFVYDDGTYTQEYLFISTERKTRAITFQKSVASIYVYSISGSYAESGNYTLTCTDFQLELGDTATSYEPYQGETYPITFPTEAGTVYGGYVDVINGELVVDRASEEFLFVNPDTSNGFDSKIFTLANTSIPSTIKNGKITNVVGDYVYTGAAYGKPHFYIGGEYFVIYLKENAYRGGTVQVCYPLAEPIHYPITSNQINSLYGQNNLWADTGDTEVEYRADVMLYINKKIAEAISALS